MVSEGYRFLSEALKVLSLEKLTKDIYVFGFVGLNRRVIISFSIFCFFLV